MNKVYIDVTQLVHWQGMITGIPRVMNELAVRFAKNDNVEFVSWVKDRQELCAIDFTATQTNRANATGGLVYKLADQEGGPAAIPARVHYKNRAKHLAKKVIRKLDIDQLEFIERMKSAVAKSESLSYQGLSVEKGDMLLIPWGEWWDADFTEKLVDYHNQGLKLIQVIHDIAPIVWPQFFEKVQVNFEDYITKIVPLSSLTLSVSKNTRNELIELLKRHDAVIPPIEVFRLGEELPVTKSTKPTDEAFVASGLKGNDYLLCVGTIEAKKNHALLYYVYKLAASRGINLPKLVIVGRRGWNTENIIDIMSRDPEVKDKFVFTSNIGDEQLSWFFDHCQATILPSFHEGWGIPIAESVARGIPCICSNTSSMVEIAEDYVVHFSPASSEECLEAILHTIQPKELARRKKDIKNYKPTSWDETYDQVNAYMKEIA